jgi:glycosyltransferase involved in cell wall biosynthesis
MKETLLILTQIVDKQDKDLGFFHRWIIEFSKNAKSIVVVCLKKGTHELPSNVKVLSLGKEQKPSRLMYVLNFYRYIWNERRNYDTVFVHMNEEYVILGAWLWKLWGKKVTMWRNHKHGTWLTPWAVRWSDKVFCTSEKSFTAKFDKTKVMPAGIDASLYSQNPVLPKKNSILFFGRLSPVKNVHVFIESLDALNKTGFDFHADIVGSPSNSEDTEYEQVLKQLGKRLVDSGKLSFHGGVSFEETLSLYGKYSLYVNLTPDGSLDKTMLEAMAARTPVLISNSAFRGQIPENCQLMSLEAGSAALKIKNLLSLNDNERKNLGDVFQKYVENTHGLSHLVNLICKEMETIKK